MNYSNKFRSILKRVLFYFIALLKRIFPSNSEDVFITLEVFVLAPTRIGIADDNVAFCLLLRDFFHSQLNLEVIAMAHNGSDTIEMLRNQPMDVLLLDLIMPELDGLSVLNWMKENQLQPRPKVIVFSAFAQEELARNAVSLGVDYFILKPFELGVLAQRIVETAKSPRDWVVKFTKKTNYQKELIDEVNQVLFSLEIPSHYKGFAYLRDAILLTVNHPELINEVTKKLYPLIANNYHTNFHRVERAMRFAIETAWNKGNVNVLHQLFGYCVDEQKGKPTNASFIAKIADQIRLRNKSKAVSY